MAVLHLANCSVSVTDVHLGWMHRGLTFDCILKTQRQKQRHHWIIWKEKKQSKGRTNALGSSLRGSGCCVCSAMAMQSAAAFQQRQLERTDARSATSS